MTRVSPVPPAPSILPAAENKPQVTTSGPDFHSQLQAQSSPRERQPDTTRAQGLLNMTMNMSRRPEMEAMLQSLEWRKNAASATNKPARPVPGARASGLDIADYSFPDRDVQVDGEVVKQACLNEHGSEFAPESVDDPTACTSDGEESQLNSDAIGGGGLNAFAIAVALSPITLTWVPIEIVRAPLRSPRIRTWRRNPFAAQSHLPDTSDSEAESPKPVLDA